jgi:ribosome-associated protein
MPLHLDDEPPESKTRRKRAMEELQALGEALAALPPDRLKKIELPEELRAAIGQVQRMSRQDDARRRQMQYIGRLMRSVDSEPIRAALAEASGHSAAGTARLHRLERLRDALLADEAALHQIAALYPGIDLQHLRSLRRAALKEKESGKPPRNYRALFHLLKDADRDGENPPDGE